MPIKWFYVDCFYVLKRVKYAVWNPTWESYRIRLPSSEITYSKFTLLLISLVEYWEILFVLFAYVWCLTVRWSTDLDSLITVQAK